MIVYSVTQKNFFFHISSMNIMLMNYEHAPGPYFRRLKLTKKRAFVNS